MITLKQKIEQEKRRLESLKDELNECYKSVQDMRVDSVTTDNAIKKMQTINLQINASKRKIKKLEDGK